VALDALVHRTRPPRAGPEGALVLMHGRGTSELDLLPLLDELDPDARLYGVAPRAPLALPPGGWHWYAVPRVGHPDLNTFWASYRLLEEWFAALPDLTGVPLSQTVLGGFSMGAVMAYALGLGRGRPAPAGVLALSGFIPTVPGFEADLGARRGLRVATVHGTRDPVISVEFARDAGRRLEDAGVDLLYREAPIAHSIDPASLPVLREWLGRTVAAASRSAPTMGGGPHPAE
jgi:phospholipase/carboxylesterase